MLCNVKGKYKGKRSSLKFLLSHYKQFISRTTYGEYPSFFTKTSKKIASFWVHIFSLNILHVTFPHWLLINHFALSVIYETKLEPLLFHTGTNTLYFLKIIMLSSSNKTLSKNLHQDIWIICISIKLFEIYTDICWKNMDFYLNF